MVDESDRLARIVSDFLTLSRLRVPIRHSVPLGEVLGELSELSRRRSDLPHGLQLETSVDPGCPDAFADGDQLRQVLSNLINNSIDAVINTSAPMVRCRARAAPADNPLGASAVEITVSDNGCGIPAELHERVFAPFFSTKSQGTGLGLSLVSRIIREHDGAVKLDSETGKGTTVTLFVPATPSSRAYEQVEVRREASS
jgi:signal transduction histidine kinase